MPRFGLFQTASAIRTHAAYPILTIRADRPLGRRLGSVVAVMGKLVDGRKLTISVAFSEAELREATNPDGIIRVRMMDANQRMTLAIAYAISHPAAA